MVDNKYKTFFLILLSVFSFSTFGLSQDAKSIEVEQGYIRETIPGTAISSAYMLVRNTSNKDIVLFGVNSKVSKRVELHEHSMANGMMKMRQVSSIIVPANGQVVLKPSGLHIMIFDLAFGLKAEDEVPLDLVFSDNSVKKVKFPVRSIKQHKHHHH